MRTFKVYQQYQNYRSLLRVASTLQICKLVLLMRKLKTTGLRQRNVTNGN
jgi:hypothetical protein